MDPWIVFKGLGTPEINTEWCTWIHILFWKGEGPKSLHQILRGIPDTKIGRQNMKNQPPILNVPGRIKNPFVYKSLFHNIW